MNLYACVGVLPVNIVLCRESLCLRCCIARQHVFFFYVVNLSTCVGVLPALFYVVNLYTCVGVLPVNIASMCESLY